MQTRFSQVFRSEVDVLRFHPDWRLKDLKFWRQKYEDHAVKYEDQSNHAAEYEDLHESESESSWTSFIEQQQKLENQKLVKDQERKTLHACVTACNFIHR